MLKLAGSNTQKKRVNMKKAAPYNAIEWNYSSIRY